MHLALYSSRPYTNTKADGDESPETENIVFNLYKMSFSMKRYILKALIWKNTKRNRMNKF